MWEVCFIYIDWEKFTLIKIELVARDAAKPP